jgi:hypothetical protein
LCISSSSLDGRGAELTYPSSGQFHNLVKVAGAVSHLVSILKEDKVNLATLYTPPGISGVTG